MLVGLARAVVAYFLVLHTGRVVLILLGSVALARGSRRARFAGLAELQGSSLTRPVSLLLPVDTGARDAPGAIRTALALRYPEFEVVVIDNGLGDDAFGRLRAEFDLVEVRCAMPRDIPVRGRVHSVHIARRLGQRLVVVRTEASDLEDTLNAGLNLARYPLVAVSDPGYVLDPQALLWLAKPFMDDPLRVVGTAAAIERPGRTARMANSLSRLGDAGRARFGCPALGNCFRAFSRDAVVSAGGFADGEIALVSR